MFRYGPPEGTVTHQTYLHIVRPTSKRNDPFKGKCRIGDRSGLRKLMRAARRDLLSPDRAHLIHQAMATAARHPTLHMSPYAKFAHALRQAAQ